MGQKPKVAFICVHNSCRSQIAEALGKYLAFDVFESYSAGTETVSQINQDAVRLMKQLYGIDMAQTQYSKLLNELPPVDICQIRTSSTQCLETGFCRWTMRCGITTPEILKIICCAVPERQTWTGLFPTRSFFISAAGQSPGSQATRTVLAFCTSITNSWPSAGSQIQQPQRTEAAGLAAFFCYGAKDFKEMGEIPIDRKEKVWYSFKAVKRQRKEYARVAELADALDSGSSEGNFMGVQVPPLAP